MMKRQKHFDGAVRLIGHAIQRAREAGVPVDDRHWNGARAVVGADSYLLSLQAGSHVVQRSFTFAHVPHSDSGALAAVADQALTDMAATLKFLCDRDARDASARCLRPVGDDESRYCAMRLSQLANDGDCAYEKRLIRSYRERLGARERIAVVDSTTDIA